MKWISIKDRLPKKGVTVATKGVCESSLGAKPIKESISAGEYTGKKWIIHSDYHINWGSPFWNTTVTHWLELPK